MSMKANFQTIIFEELRNLFQPLSDLQGDDERIIAFIRWLGWDLKAVTQNNNSSFLTAFTNVVNQCYRMNNNW
jgi:hypothetical protein